MRRHHALRSRAMIIVAAAFAYATGLASFAAADPGSAPPGWKEIPHGHPGNEDSFLEDVAVTGEVAWAVGDRLIDVTGVIERRNWALRCEGFQCERTSPRDLEDPPNTRNALYGVDGTSPSDVWAVGVARDPASGRDIGRTHHFDGSSWTVVSNPHRSGSIDAVSAVATDDVWAVGSGGLATDPIVVLHWDGTSWSKVPFKVSGRCKPYAFWPPDIAADGRFPIVAGACETRRHEYAMVVSYRHGQWRRDELPGFKPDYTMRSVSWVGRRAWVAGSTKSPDTGEGLPVVARWRAGHGWERVDPGFEEEGGVINGIDGSGRRNVWAVGDANSDIIPITARWDGTSWTVVDTADQRLILLGGVGVSDRGVAWAAGWKYGDPFWSAVLRHR